MEGPLPEPTDPIHFKPVNTENWDDFESFFQSRLSYCWCMAWRMTLEERKQNNPGCRKEFIRQRILSGVPVGILGYINDQPIAWCSVAPRETYQRLGGEESLEKVWSITCFYVSKEFRVRGIVGELIEKAKEYAKSSGAKYLEAYPVEPDSPSYRFMGFIGTFENAGFKQVKMAGSRRHVMVLPL